MKIHVFGSIVQRTPVSLLYLLDMCNQEIQRFCNGFADLSGYHHGECQEQQINQYCYHKNAVQRLEKGGEFHFIYDKPVQIMDV